MFKSIILLTVVAAVPAFGRTVHSVLVFSRHGDRTSKFYKNYQMTNLGAVQCFNSGTYYRNRYVAARASDQIAGISPPDVDHSQLWFSAPDQSVLFQTAQNFAQGLYPPLGSLDEDLATEELANGTSIESPLNGYQCIHIQGEAENAPDTIWLKGDDECPAWTNDSKEYKVSDQYQQTLNSSQGFYDQFVPLLGDILGLENVSYAQAYNVFDLLNTAYVQNASVSEQIVSEDLAEARYLADEWEWNMNFNASNLDRVIGGMSLAGGILRQLEAVVQDEAATKFSLMTGSYDTFLAFFGLVDLASVSTDFMGLPDYASTMAFEVFSEADNASFPTNPEDDLRIRYLFRNGTGSDEELTAYPLFGQEDEAMAYGAFMSSLRDRAITSVSGWCKRCGANADFCLAETSNGTAEQVTATESSGSALSNAAAGGIGAGVTIAVVAILGLALWVFLSKRRKQTWSSMIGEKTRSDSGSSSNVV
ncbi:hypothetical protein M409DRAFT_22096 [Zasmidium cellare ATCC 36951]|uniref:Acid phosphatase n=1 Tax=Zasmidium cellare ATCC 36951 TaxID=1080233 RepID=A0A6A6CLM9_ZASCE|nr:uncharacterized protein M409DRAFT_22096 [Zasmidium cellare ATCC 36951]KAF2167951.1 hypothetical protein M409DRAFT_22096 [Zasmidium cellare ATCC 36951]